MDADLVDQVVSTAARVVASGAISANGHGNVSIRVPGDLQAAALQRAMTFDSRGTVRA